MGFSVDIRWGIQIFEALERSGVGEVFGRAAPTFGDLREWSFHARRDSVIRATCKQLGIAVFVFVASVSGIRADAANAFLPVSADPLATPLASAGIGAPKERLVRIARNDLGGVRDDVASRGSGRLVLNMDAWLELGVAVERTSPTRWGYSLSGRIDSPTPGFVTLVVHDEVVAGAIWTPDASYEIVHLGGGVHAVRELAEKQGRCGGSVAASEAQSFVWPENTHAGDEDTVVDVLVVWTPQREEEVGGVDAVRAEIELGIAYTNDAFERSGAFVSLNLVGAEQVTDYEEPNVDESGNDQLKFWTRVWAEHRRLIDPSDGHMDAVHGRRDALGADLVSLATHKGSWIGGGVAGFASWHSVSVYGEPRTVAHEFGHNFGLSHEREQWWDTYPRSYEHGHVAFRGLRCTPTIMAYGGACGRASLDRRYGGGGRLQVDYIPFFSSPELFRPIDGAPLGMSRFSDNRGTDGPADAVLHLNRMRHAVAGFKPGRS